MQKRQLGNSDLSISPLGLGTWAIGGPWQHGWGPQNDSDSLYTIHAALDAGINWIDTAPAYGLGHAERIIGKALQNRAEKPLLFTKCSLVWDTNSRITHSQHAESIRTELEHSLRRLQTDVIDLYQIHWPSPPSDLLEGWETLLRLKEEGKIRHIGLCNYSVKKMRPLHQMAPICSLQLPYNLLDRRAETELFPWCQKKCIGVICYSPLASGLLSGKMTRERIRQMDPGDWRTKSRDFSEPQLSYNLARAARLSQTAEKYQSSPAALTLAWTLLHPAISGTIVGLRHPHQLKDVLAACELQIFPADKAALEAP